MLNVYELEKRWLKYKTKSLLPIISFVAILFIVIAIIILSIDLKKLDFLNTSVLEKITSNTQTEEKNLPKEEPQEVVYNAIQKTKKLPEIETKLTPEQVHEQTSLVEETTLLEPSINFMKKMHTESNLQYHEQTQKKSPATPNVTKQESIQKKSTPIVTHQKAQKKEEQAQQKTTEDVNVIKIKKQNTYEDIDYVLKRFKKNNNPALSLFIAKKYYELGDYKQAYNYALITNKINNNIEASWIVFSKSLVKLKQKKKAIKTLQQYINHSGSNQARLLLEDILSGKFQ